MLCHAIYTISWEGEQGILIEVDAQGVVCKALSANGTYRGGLTGRKVDELFADLRCTWATMGTVDTAS